MGNYRHELETAKKAALSAGDYLLEHRRKNQIAVNKGSNKDFALLQDLESDKIIKRIISEAFPKDFILSEESKNNIPVATKRMWIIDPIDGTRNFGSGLSYFAVSIALWEDGQPKVGIVYGPALGEMFEAIVGKGATLNDKPLAKLDENKSLQNSLVVTGFSYFKGIDLSMQLVKYEKVLNQAIDVLRFGSAALDLCQVAAGRIGSYYESGIKPWDIGAGMLILEEVGGQVGDYGMQPIKFFNKSAANTKIAILASANTSLQREISSILCD